MTKTITVTEWRKMKVYSEPTETTGMIKMDRLGLLWIWVSGGKRVTVKRYIA